MLTQSISVRIQTPAKPTEMRHFRIASLAILALLLSSGQSSSGQASDAQSGSSSGCIGYCGNGVAIGIGVIAGVAATVGIILIVNHNNHLLQGCVSDGPNGPELKTSGSETYALEGDSSVVKAGSMVKVHGSKVKKAKNSSGNKAFKVDKLKKDYGPCHVSGAPAAGSAS
jgi:hypothetical protein